MRRLIPLLFTSIVLGAAAPAPDGADLVARSAVVPVEAGPLKLGPVHRLKFSHDLRNARQFLVAPDGEHAVRWADYGDARLEISAENRSDLISAPGARATRFAVGDLTQNRGGVLAWSEDSQVLFSADRDVLNPSNFPTGPLKLQRISPGGMVTALPEFHDPAGPLDAIRWIGGRGLALAQFGVSGDSYRPPHADPAPTLAMIDAVRGRVLARLPFDQVAAWTHRRPGLSAQTFVRDATAVTLRNGRMRAVIVFDDWLVWTEGEAPKTLTNPYPPNEARLTLTPDGSRLLLIHALQATSCPQYRVQLADQPACSPTPVEGVLAELRDVVDGHVLWSLRGRVAGRWSAAAPAISADGRYALISLPPDGGERAALISMADGKIVQIFKTPFAPTFGVAGRQFWIAGADGVIQVLVSS